jgi:DNA-binding MarR family transcriptional regulator
VRIAADAAGTPQRQIGMLLGLDPSAVVALVDDLERAGLVLRQPDPDDRRTRLITVTEAGLSLLAQIEAVAQRVQDEVLEALAPDQRARFVRMLQQIVG